MIARASALAVTIAVLGCADDRGGASPWVGLSQGGADDGASDDTGADGSDDDHASMADDDGDDDDDGEDTGASDERGDDSSEGTGPVDDTDDDAHDTRGVECPDGCYCEPLDPHADIDDLIAAYDPSAWDQTLFAVLERRWPAGRDLLTEQQGDPYFGSFTDTSSFAGLMDGLMTEAHEGTHGWDYGNAGVDTFAYFLRGDLKLYPDKLHGFDRSEIYGMVEGSATDLYKDLYLVGEQGTYGFYELLDEGNCYINGMAAIGVVGEHIPYGISGRDGAVAFLYYLELYLRRARTEYPDVYAQIQGDPVWVELVQTQWLRTHFHLEHTAELHPQLGIYDGEIEALLYAPDNQAEIEMLVGHALDASSCLP